MAIPRDWQTMQMRSVEEEEYNSRRVPILNVFFPNKDELPPESQWLKRSAFARVVRGQVNEDTKHRIAVELVFQFGCTFVNLTVQEVDEASAHFVIIFPNLEIRDRVLARGSFISNGTESDPQQIEVAIEAWRPEFGSHYDPVKYRARIRLRGVPFHLWNKTDIRRLIAGFGYPIEIAPFFSNGNFSCLRLLIACGPPSTIPEKLWVTVDPELRMVQVDLEGWLTDSDLGGFPPNEGETSRARNSPPLSSSSVIHQNPNAQGAGRRPFRHGGPRSGPY